MAATPRKEVTQARDREAWRLRQQGWTEGRIAAELGVNESSVCRALQRIGKRLAGEFKEHAEAVKAEQTEQLRQVYAEALAAWRRSLEDEETVVSGRVHASKDGDLTDLPDQVTRRGQSGNPALLAQARGALEDIRSVWGLDAPKKQELSTDGPPFKVYVAADDFNPDEA